MVRLLDACVQTLGQQGKRKMYIDAVRWGDAGFQSMGSCEFPLFYIIFLGREKNTDTRSPDRISQVGKVQRNLAGRLKRLERSMILSTDEIKNKLKKN